MLKMLILVFSNFNYVLNAYCIDVNEHKFFIYGNVVFIVDDIYAA